MKIVIAAQGVSGGGDLEGQSIPPAWRKATRTMMMAVGSIDRALSEVPGWMERAHEATGLVLASNSGELETSADFLLTLSRQKIARPVLFQNSLHNATTGFASIHFKLTGPTFTVSSGRENPREALFMAEALLREGSCRACLVTLVETHRVLAGFIHKTVDEGAATLLLADESFSLELGFRDRPEFIFADWAESFPEPVDTGPLFPITTLPMYRRIAARP